MLSLSFACSFSILIGKYRVGVAACDQHDFTGVCFFYYYVVLHSIIIGQLLLLVNFRFDIETIIEDFAIKFHTYAFISLECIYLRMKCLGHEIDICSVLEETDRHSINMDIN